VAVPETVFDFGKLTQGTPIAHSFTVRNTGDVPLRYDRAELSLPGMRIRVTPAVIAPGTEAKATIDWTTTRIAGKVEGVARIRWEDAAIPEVAVTLKGTIVPSIAIEPLPAVFLSAFGGEPVVRNLTIRNNEAKPLAITGVHGGEHVTVTLDAVEAGRTYAVAVRAAPQTEPGRYEETITLTTDKPGQERITLPVHLWVKPDLYANPDTVDFGTVRQDQLQQPGVATQAVMLKRRSGNFEIIAVTSDSPMIEVIQRSTGPSESIRLDVRLHPEPGFRGQLASRIRVRTNDPKFPEIAIPVTGSVL